MYSMREKELRKEEVSKGRREETHEEKKSSALAQAGMSVSYIEGYS